MTARSVDEVLALYEEWGRHRYDEEVTQLEHALQTAACAVTDRAPDTLVVAALLHDAGHLLHLRDGGQPGEEDVHHEAVGAAWLADLFPPAVTIPIAAHVLAKRYLCAVDPSYQRALSSGSTASLAAQGGPMTADEVARYEARAGHDDATRLRRWDDNGKVIGAGGEPLGAYEGLLHQIWRWAPGP